MESVGNLIAELNSRFPWVRKRALKKLIEVGLPAVKEIITALDTPFLQVWALLIDALVQIGNPALKELEKSLSHSNSFIRISAMHAIGKIGHPSAVDLLLPFLDSTESHERKWAIEALGFTRSPRAYEIIVSALENKTVNQDSAIAALGALGDIRAYEIIVSALENQTVDQDIAIEALGALGDIRALPKLEKIAASYKKLEGRYGYEKRVVVDEAIKSIKKENEQ